MPTTLVLDDGVVDAFEEEGDDGLIKKISVPVDMWASRPTSPLFVCLQSKCSLVQPPSSLRWFRR
jgi:hypothetical protein